MSSYWPWNTTALQCQVFNRGRSLCTPIIFPFTWLKRPHRSMLQHQSLHTVDSNPLILWCCYCGSCLWLSSWKYGKINSVLTDSLTDTQVVSDRRTSTMRVPPWEENHDILFKWQFLYLTLEYWKVSVRVSVLSEISLSSKDLVWHVAIPKDFPCFCYVLRALLCVPVQAFCHKLTQDKHEICTEQRAQRKRRPCKQTTTRAVCMLCCTFLHRWPLEGYDISSICYPEVSLPQTWLG